MLLKAELIRTAKRTIFEFAGPVFVLGRAMHPEVVNVLLIKQCVFRYDELF